MCSKSSLVYFSASISPLEEAPGTWVLIPVFISGAFTHRYLETVWRQTDGVPSLSSGGQSPIAECQQDNRPREASGGKVLLVSPTASRPQALLGSVAGLLQSLCLSVSCTGHIRSRARPAPVLAPLDDACSHIASRYDHTLSFRISTPRELLRAKSVTPSRFFFHWEMQSIPPLNPSFLA